MCFLNLEKHCQSRSISACGLTSAYSLVIAQLTEQTHDCRALCQLLGFDRLSFILSLYISLSFSLSEYNNLRVLLIADVCVTPLGVWKEESSYSSKQDSDSRITDVDTMKWRMNRAKFIRCSIIHLLDSLIWSQMSCALSALQDAGEMYGPESLTWNITWILHKDKDKVFPTLM